MLDRRKGDLFLSRDGSTWWIEVSSSEYPHIETDYEFSTSGVNSLVRKWRRDGDSNPGGALTPTRFPGVRLKPLGHLSNASSQNKLLKKEGFHTLALFTRKRWAAQ